MTLDRFLPRTLRTGAVLLLLAALGGCAVAVRPGGYDGPGYYRGGYHGPYRQAPLPAYPSVEYGVVQRIDISDVRAQPTGAGTVAGGLIGGAVGSQFGGGSGRALATVLGVFGGAVVGTQIEQQTAAAASYRVYHVVVRFDSGERRVFDYRAVGGLRAGDRVRLESGALGPA